MIIATTDKAPGPDSKFGNRAQKRRATTRPPRARGSESRCGRLTMVSHGRWSTGFGIDLPLGPQTICHFRTSLERPA